MIKPTSASFMISENCNLNCSYCFEPEKNNKNMSSKIALSGVKILFDNFKYNIENKYCENEDIVKIMLFGGEPLLNFETISNLLIECDNLKEKTNINYAINLITNGTIINNEIVNILKIYSDVLKIQLSIDGTKETHDYYRKYHNGYGSFDIIMKNISMFKEIFGGEDFYKTENRLKLNIHGALNKKTLLDMYKSWKFFTEKLKIPGIWFMPIKSEKWDERDVKIYEEQLKKIANDILIKTIIKRDKIYLNDYHPLDECLKNKNSFDNKPCGAGDTYITFTANGDIYPCHHFYFLEKKYAKIGSVFDGIDEYKRKMYSNYTSNDMNCSKKNCKNYNCKRCIAENYSVNGTLLNCKIDPRCDMMSVEKKIIFTLSEAIKKYL